ncbi:MAG: hypothetical protein KJZ54_07665 [Phycisphaerales bacterium]|nr:hypothetical protein [Phycisphaerales bacterium]
MTLGRLCLTTAGAAMLTLAPSDARAQFNKAFDTDREYQSAAGPAEPTEHFALDVFLKAPAVVDRLVSVGSRTLPTGQKGLHVVFWSDKHTIIDEWLIPDHFQWRDLVGYDVKVAANKRDILIAGQYRDNVSGAAGVFACSIDTVTPALNWVIGLTGEYQTPVLQWSIERPSVTVDELPNGDVVVARTMYYNFTAPSVGLVTCLDSAGNPKWSKYYTDGVGLGRSLELLDMAIVPPGSVNAPPGSIMAAGSFGNRAFILNIDPVTGHFIGPTLGTVYDHVDQWRAIDFDPVSHDMVLSGMFIDQMDFCSGPQLVVGRLTPGTCGVPPSSNWLMHAVGLDFIPAPGAISFRRPPVGSPERVLVAGSTTCYDEALGMTIDGTGIPLRTWSDSGGAPTSYVRTHDLAGSRLNFTPHTIGSRGLAGAPPEGVYISAANCVQEVDFLPDGLPIECYADDTVGVYPDDLIDQFGLNQAPTQSVEVHTCRNNPFGGGVNDLPDPKIWIKWPP